MNTNIYRYLTIFAPKDSVKWIIAVILHNRLVLILRARYKGHPSVQQGFGLSAINYCK